jgi:hypothetical protein
MHSQDLGVPAHSLTGPERRRALRHAVITKRRADRLGAIADRLLTLVQEAISSGTDGQTPTKRRVRGRGRRTLAAGRAQALRILAGIDATNPGTTPTSKGLPSNLVPQAIYCAMQAVRLAAELNEKAAALDLHRAAAKAEAVARAQVAGTIDAKVEARAREQAAWVASGEAAPRTETRGRPTRPALFDESDPDDPLAHLFTVEAEPPDDLPEPIVPGQAVYDAGERPAATARRE